MKIRRRSFGVRPITSRSDPLKAFPNEPSGDKVKLSLRGHQRTVTKDQNPHSPLIMKTTTFHNLLCRSRRQEAHHCRIPKPEPPYVGSDSRKTHRSIMRITITAILVLYSTLITGCHRSKPAAAPKNVVRVVAAESLASCKMQARSEYIAMLKGDVETDLSFKVAGLLELMGRTGEIQDWQEGARVAKGEILARLKQEDFVSAVKSARARAEMDLQQFERELKLRETGAVSQQEL